MSQHERQSARPVHFCKADEVETGHGQTEGMVRQVRYSLTTRLPNLFATARIVQTSPDALDGGARPDLVLKISEARVFQRWKALYLTVHSQL